MIEIFQIHCISILGKWLHLISNIALITLQEQQLNHIYRNNMINFNFLQFFIKKN